MKKKEFIAKTLHSLKEIGELIKKPEPSLTPIEQYRALNPVKRVLLAQEVAPRVKSQTHRFNFDNRVVDSKGCYPVVKVVDYNPYLDSDREVILFSRKILNGQDAGQKTYSDLINFYRLSKTGKIGGVKVVLLGFTHGKSGKFIKNNIR